MTDIDEFVKKLPLINEEDYYIKSLYHRLNNQFDEDLHIAHTALSKFLGSEYFAKRLEWHHLPLFEKMEPRPPLNEDAEENFKPSDEMLEQMCFVTIASPEVYHSLVQTIESVKAIKDYANIPYYIIGLPSSPFEVTQADELKTRFGITDIKYPNLEEWFPDTHLSISAAKGSIQANYIYPFIDEMVEHKNIFFIEADVWVKHRSCIDRMLHHLKDDEISMPNPNMGIYCIKSKSTFSQTWKRYLLSIDPARPSVDLSSSDVAQFYQSYRKAKGFFHPVPTEFIQMYLFPAGRYLNDIYDDVANNVGLEGFPFWRNNTQVNEQGKIIGCFHVRYKWNGLRHLKNIDRNKVLTSAFYQKCLYETYYVPTPNFECFDGNLRKHVNLARLYFATNDINMLPTHYKHLTPIKYRIYPWSDKPILEIKLRELINSRS